MGNNTSRRRSPLRSIRAFCIECQGDLSNARRYVRECKDIACYFYPYRLGIPPEGQPHQPLSAIKTYSSLEQRYMELYAYWKTELLRRPICKNSIGDAQAREIRPAVGPNHGKETYRKALEAAIEYGYAEKVPAPPGGSNKAGVEYYVLHSLEESITSNPPAEDSSLVEDNED